MITIEVTAYNAKPVSVPIRAEFGEAGGTIGRSPGNTLVLLDPDRKISRTHATLLRGADGFVLRDQGSVVPVMVNGQPVGNGRESAIRCGDEIRIGGYVMCVVAVASDSKEAPAPAPQAQAAEVTPATPPAATEMAAPVLSWDSDQAAAAKPGITTVILAAEHAAPVEEVAATGVADIATPVVERPTPVVADATPAVESATPVVESVAPAAASAAPAVADVEPTPPAPPIPPVSPSAPAPVAAKASTAPATSDELMRALLAGAGLANLEIPGGLSPQLMNQLGQILREATRGLLDLLAARANTKRKVRADMTVIVSQDNNPLKFSPSMDAALSHLLVPRGRGFMPPLRAVDDAYEDLRAHQLGFMAGMRSALTVVLSRFDPKELEHRLTQTTVADSLLPMHRKAKLWDLFGEHYALISKEAEGDFQSLFGQEFLKAYQAHAAKAPERHDGTVRH